MELLNGICGKQDNGIQIMALSTGLIFVLGRAKAQVTRMYLFCLRRVTSVHLGANKSSCLFFISMI